MLETFSVVFLARVFYALYVGIVYLSSHSPYETCSWNVRQGVPFTWFAGFQMEPSLGGFNKVSISLIPLDLGLGEANGLLPFFERLWSLFCRGGY